MSDNLPFNHFKEQDQFLFAKALEATSNGVIITDNSQQDNPIIYCNDAFQKLTGYSRDQIIGHNCRFLQGDDLSQQARRLLADAIKNGESCDVVIKNYKKNGTPFWNELYISPVKNEQGKVTHFIGIQNDITLRKEVELQLKKEQEMLEKKIEERTQEIKASEQYSASIVETIRESLVVLNGDIEVLGVNDYFYRTFKVSESETIGRKLYDLGDGQWDIPGLRDLLERVLPHNNPFEDFVVEHKFPHIGRKVMMLNARQIAFKGQYQSRILLAIEDATARVDIENRKDDFLSVASHELKTPLTSIKGYVQLLQRQIPDNADEKFKSTLAKTDSYINRLNNLIDELLNVTRLQSGQIEFDFASFDFDQMIAQAVDAVQATTKNHELKIQGKVDHKCYGDKDRLEQVVINLLANAVKYSPDSSAVNIYVSRVSNFIKVAITDFGLGIEKKDHKKIFERFYRVDNVQQKFPGIGIGLYVCEQIVKQHNGTLWVESELKKGATFSFTLPVNQSPNE